jgi:hypothetical protein
MGTLTYNSALAVAFDDRVLLHVQTVIGAKLRRGESFYFTWDNEPAPESGRTTIWIHPSLGMAYTYVDSVIPVLNRSWIEALSVSANSASGLHLIPEPEPVTAPARVASHNR